MNYLAAAITLFVLTAIAGLVLICAGLMLWDEATPIRGRDDPDLPKYLLAKKLVWLGCALLPFGIIMAVLI